MSLAKFVQASAVAAGALVAATQVNAADIYAGGGGFKDAPIYAPAPSWAGFYFGLNGGSGWANDKQLVVANPAFNGLSPDGGFGGGQIGYNFQGGLYPGLVLGLEADFEGADIHDFSRSGIYWYNSGVDYFGTVRGRIGFAAERTLFYLTGGFAYGDLTKGSNRLVGDAYSDTASGYVLGGGLEFKLTPAWSIKAEYQYLNFGQNDPVSSIGHTFSADTGVNQKDDDYHTVRVGLNYHVGYGYEPLK